MPNSTITNWVREFERWTPKLRVVPFYGEARAREIIKKFERGAENVRGDEEVSDTVSQHMLEDKTGLFDEKWLGTPEEELSW